MSIGFMSVQISAQFMLTRYGGPSQVGIYAAANQFSLGIWLLALSGQQAFLPWLFKTLRKNDPKNDHKIVAAIIGSVAILAVCTVAYIVILEFIFPLVIGRRFTRGDLLLGPLAWANFFLGVQMVMNCFLYYRKLTGISAACVCVAAAFGLAFGIWRIPLGGAAAAAETTELSAALAALITIVAVAWNFASIFRNGARTLLRARPFGIS
jgi:O-antigen/teichoic acid export membrane protein